MSDRSDYSWAIPIMRAGYAGRGVTYLAVAGLSLWAIWRGGSAEGTGSTLETLSKSGWGTVVLWLIAIGLLAYAVWRGIDAAEDLEDYGTDAKGLVARAGMIVTGLIHAAIGALALSLALGLGLSEGGGGGGVSGIVGTVLDWPGGALVVGFGGVATIGAGLYYLKKGVTADYRETLADNTFTRNWDWMLRAGVIAQAVIILIVGGFLLMAAMTGNEGSAGGLGKAFDWLRSQAFGNALVVILCLGLLGFAFFCFVNATHRIIPRVAHGHIRSLGTHLRSLA